MAVSGGGPPLTITTGRLLPGWNGIDGDADDDDDDDTGCVNERSLFIRSLPLVLPRSGLRVGDA
jgi:hypothetical protein